MITITVHQHIEPNQPQAAPRSKKKMAPFEEQQRQPLASSQDDNQPAARKSLHAKSISLVINPNFWPVEPSGWPGPKPSARRSRASRRNLPSWASSSDCSLFSSCPSVASLGQSEAQSEAQQQPQTLEKKPEGQPEEAHPLETFRQAGAILRHISDQFTQSRRRTI